MNPARWRYAIAIPLHLHPVSIPFRFYSILFIYLPTCMQSTLTLGRTAAWSGRVDRPDFSSRRTELVRTKTSKIRGLDVWETKKPAASPLLAEKRNLAELCAKGFLSAWYKNNTIHGRRSRRLGADGLFWVMERLFVIGWWGWVYTWLCVILELRFWDARWLVWVMSAKAEGLCITYVYFMLARWAGALIVTLACCLPW